MQYFLNLQLDCIAFNCTARTARAYTSTIFQMKQSDQSVDFPGKKRKKASCEKGYGYLN